MADTGDRHGDKSTRQADAGERHHTQESPEYRLLVLGLFPLFLAAAVLVRVLTLGGGRLVASEDRGESVFAEARAAADTILPWAFSKG